MKTLHLSKFSIFMISIVVFAISVYAVIVLTSPSAVSSQNDRIYLHSPGYPGSSESPKGYVKISDMAPNDFGYFMYPSSYNFSDSANAYQRFLLIRLPSWLGGDKNDISSYRAYSMIDLDSHCMVKYWPQDGRQRIEDPCHFEEYRAIDGASYFFGIKIMVKPVENALPQLDLGVDKAGYIYVKTPTWTVDKNGLIGDGRHLSKDQVLNSSKFLLEKYEDVSRNNIPIPLSLEDGSFLIDVLYYGDKTADFRYTLDTPTLTAPSIGISYCNCTGWLDDGSHYHIVPKYTQAWQFDNHTVYASDPYVDGNEKPLDIYDFEFYQNGYHVTFHSVSAFDQGMKMTLDTFFNGTKLSDIKQISIEK